MEFGEPESQMGFPGGSVVRNPLSNAGDLSLIPPGVRKISCRRNWQPTPVSLPGESYGEKSLVGYSSWGGKKLDMTE